MHRVQKEAEIRERRHVETKNDIFVKGKITWGQQNRKSCKKLTLCRVQS